VFSKQFKKGKKCHVTLWLISLHPPCVIWWHCRGPLECHVLFEWLLMNLKTCLELFESKNVCLRVRLGSNRHLYKYHTRVEGGEGQDMPKKCHLLFEWPLSCFLNLDYHQWKLIFEIKTSLGNVRPAGHMRPAKHLNVARELCLNFSK